MPRRTPDGRRGSLTIIRLIPVPPAFTHTTSGKSHPGLLAHLEGGASLALVTDAGTPVVSDPGQGLVREAIARGIRVEAIPGPSAILAALVASGMGAEGFTFLGIPAF